MTTNKTLLTINEAGLRVSSHEVSEKLAKKNLSPSLISGLGNCPASWLGNEYVVRPELPEDRFGPARKGTLFHQVMENFFALDPDLRTISELKRITRDTIMSDDFSDMAVPDIIEWLKDAINGYVSMGGNPKSVQVAELEIYGKKKKGLEMFVKGKLGNARRETLGFVDRISVSKKGGVIVEDWKTSVEAKHWSPTDKKDRGWGEQRQQIIYSLLLEAEGIKVDGARLLYPVARDFVTVDKDDETLRARVISDVEEADKALDAMIEENLFDFNPGPLCAWCPLVKICPAGTVFKPEKFQKAFETQPEQDQLSPFIAFE